eukprot:TRINITY_DN12412_c1_g1_i1.p1 TRINITY_DN12412_c1_g1~~TRINITY_DN12412_c1_g1_i1.p1  ORF type:complete len:215 (+),score=25.51 TRINITY_DN12412_c1_g1_i1:70-714(+)
MPKTDLPSRPMSWTSGHPFFSNLNEGVIKENAYYIDGRGSAPGGWCWLEEKWEQQRPGSHSAMAELVKSWSGGDLQQADHERDQQRPGTSGSLQRRPGTSGSVPRPIPARGNGCLAARGRAAEVLSGVEQAGSEFRDLQRPRTQGQGAPEPQRPLSSGSLRRKTMGPSKSAPALVPAVKLDPPRAPEFGFGTNLRMSCFGHHGGRFGSVLYWGA